MYQPNGNAPAVFGEDCEFCPATGRPFERGSGALPKDEQTRLFVHEAAYAVDIPIEGERCSQTGREYEVGSGCLPKSIQSRNFLNELPQADKDRRAQRAAALAAIEPAGTA